MKRTRVLARVATPIAAVAGALLLAGPAFAHVEVESETPQALATAVMVDFDAEGESGTAGITEVRVSLPTGIAPSDLVLVHGPSGWTLKPTEDGYTVAGPALTPGKSAAYTIKVRQLPDAKELAFKSLVTYSDGHVDRWIELPQAGVKLEHPAPVLKLSAAAPGATPVATASPTAAASAPASSAAPLPAAPTTAAASQAAAELAKTSGGGGGVVIAVIVAAVCTTGVLVWRRRSARS